MPEYSLSGEESKYEGQFKKSGKIRSIRRTRISFLGDGEQESILEYLAKGYEGELKSS